MHTLWSEYMPTQSLRIIWFQSLSMISWRLSKFLIPYAFHCSQTWRMPKSWLNAWYIRKSLKTNIDFVREGRTSMSPRLYEITIFFEKWNLYLAFCKVFRRSPNLGTAENKCFLVKKVWSKLFSHEKVKKSDAFAREVRTSMSPHLNENAIF